MKQALRRVGDDRRKVIGDEIARLLASGFIMEVLHSDWLANPVLVEKKKDDPNVAIVDCTENLNGIIGMNIRCLLIFLV